MAFFVSGRVAVTATGVIDEKDITPDLDVVFIRPIMDYGTRQRVNGAAAKVSAPGGNRQQRRAARARGEGLDMKIDVGAYQIALLTENILAWQGPSFTGVACERKNIERINPSDPLAARVIQEIADRNVDGDSGSEAEDDEPEGAAGPNVIEAEPIKSLAKS